MTFPSPFPAWPGSATPGAFSPGDGGAGTAVTLSVVKTTPSGTFETSANVPGPVSVSPGNTEGNMLAVFAAWDVSTAGGCTAPVPASAVADSAGNWWRLATDSGPSVTGSRCAIWVCPNALAIPGEEEGGWLSCALQSYASTFEFTVAEFEGLPAGYYPAIDFGAFAAASNDAGTTLTITQVASAADVCLSMAAAGVYEVNPPAITGPGTAWTAIASGTAGTFDDALYNTGASAAYGAFSAGTVTSAWTFGSSASISACMCALTQASQTITQTNPDFPVVKLEAAFGAAPGDPTMAILDTGWTDLTGRTLTPAGAAGISAGRGKQYELAQPEAGVLSAQMNNVDGAFDPYWPGSEFYSSAVNENMSFQASLDPWTAASMSGTPVLAQSTAQTFASSYGGSAVYSLQVTPGSAVNPGAQSEKIPVSVNDPYTGSAWFYSAAGWATGAQVGVNWFTSAGGYISSSFVAATAIPAGAWTQVTTGLGLTVPGSAATGQLIVQFEGTPATVFWVAEAALAHGTAPVLTGLVRLETPVRVSAYWEGRQYPVGSGYVERWPQDWPDLPQWGMSAMIATDQAGVAASTNMPSAVQGEILADAPYACFPFSEQYATSTNTINGATSTATECDGLIAVNTSRVNQQTATYHDGGLAPVETGQSLAFEGDSGTGMGATGYTTFDLSGERGPGVQYGPDDGLPAITTTSGVTVETWYNVASIADTGTITTVQLLQVLGQPYQASSGTAHVAPGWILGAGLYFPSSGSVVTYLGSATNPDLTVGTSPTIVGALQHLVVVIFGENIGFYLNGVYQGTIADTAQAAQITGLTFGEASWPFTGAFGYQANWNYGMAYGTVYPYLLGPRRVVNHYTSGTTGFSGDTIMQRFGRYLAWCATALNPAGPGSITDDLGLGPAYSTSGSPIASALNNDVLSAGATWFCNANGNLVVLPRPALYNLASTVTFGDSNNPLAGEIPYERGTGFDYDNTYLSNITQATLTQGPNTLIAPIEKDETSIGEYFARGPLQQSVSAATAQDAYDRAYWSLEKYKQPSMRVRTLTVDVASKPGNFSAILQTDLADIATVNRRPVGGPAYSLPVQIQKVQHDIGPGVWNVTYQMSPYAPEDAVLTADTGNDVLGSNTLAW